MFHQSTKARHGAPRQRRGWLRVSRPACGLIPAPVVPVEAPVVPSMDLPEGHMEQRPYTPSPVYVGTVLAKATRYRKDDEIVITGGYSGHVGRHGIVESAYGRGRPLVVDVDGGIVYLDEDDVRLVRRPSDADTETFPAVQVPVVTVEHGQIPSFGFWLPLDDTLVLDAVELDELPLMGGASR